MSGGMALPKVRHTPRVHVGCTRMHVQALAMHVNVAMWETWEGRASTREAGQQYTAWLSPPTPTTPAHDHNRREGTVAGARARPGKLLCIVLATRSQA